MANRLLGGGFQDVDRTGTPEAFAKYLEHIGTDERVRRLNRKRAEAAGIAAGHRVLDVGCGVGFDASLLAELVAPAGKVIGIDHSAAMVERAAARLAGSGLPVEFRTADAHALPFDGGAFDVQFDFHPAAAAPHVALDQLLVPRLGDLRGFDGNGVRGEGCGVQNAYDDEISHHSLLIPCA